MSQRWLTVPAGADPVLLVNATAAPETVALDRLTPGRCVIVRREDSVAANTVTIGVPTGWTLDGVTDATTTIDADSEMRFIAIDLGFQSYGSGSSAAEVSAAVAAEATARNAAIATQHATDLNTYGQLWATPAVSTTLTGTLAAWTVAAVDCTAGAGARTLPAANSVAAGVAVAVKKADTSPNALVVSRAGSDLIYGTGAGATSKTLTLAGEAVEFVSNGVDKWTVRASDTPSGVLATTFAPIGAFGGNLSAVLGDSLANNGDGVAYWIAALTNQRFCFPSASYIQSHPGYTSAQIAAIVSQITALSPRPRYCFVSVGSNDAATGVSSTAFMANIVTIYSGLRAAGIIPVAMGVPPRISVYGLIAEYNLRLYRYATSTATPFLDQFSLLVDPATGLYLAAYDSGDGIHPSSAGCKAIATRAATDLAPLAPPAINLASLAMSTGNVQPQAAHLLDGNSDGIADPNGATPSSGFAYSRVADAQGWYWQRVTLTSAAGAKTINGSNLVLPTVSTTLAASASASATTLSTNAAPSTGGSMYKLAGANGTYEIVRVNSVTGSGPYTVTLSSITPLKFAHSSGDTLTPFAAIGDTLGFAVRVRSGQDAATLVPQFTMYTAAQGSVTKNVIMTSPNTSNGFRRQLVDGVLYAEAVIPASTVSVQFSFQCGPEDGTYDFALPYLVNLSAVPIP